MTNVAMIKRQQDHTGAFWKTKAERIRDSRPSEVQRMMTGRPSSRKMESGGNTRRNAGQADMQRCQIASSVWAFGRACEAWLTSRAVRLSGGPRPARGRQHSPQAPAMWPVHNHTQDCAAHCCPNRGSNRRRGRGMASHSDTSHMRWCRRPGTEKNQLPAALTCRVVIQQLPAIQLESNQDRNFPSPADETELAPL